MSDTTRGKSLGHKDRYEHRDSVLTNHVARRQSVASMTTNIAGE